MLKWMMHETHGLMPVYDPDTYKLNVSRGWAECDEPKPDAPRPVVWSEPSLAEKYKAKFGKPPHHRMKPETIARALEQ